MTQPDTTAANNPTACLRCAGLLGHTHAVVEPDDGIHAIAGWRLVAQCGGLRSARRIAQQGPGRRVYERIQDGQGWLRVH